MAKKYEISGRESFPNLNIQNLVFLSGRKALVLTESHLFDDLVGIWSFPERSFSQKGSNNWAPLTTVLAPKQSLERCRLICLWTRSPRPFDWPWGKVKRQGVFDWTGQRSASRINPGVYRSWIKINCLWLETGSITFQISSYEHLGPPFLWIVARKCVHGRGCGKSVGYGSEREAWCSLLLRVAGGYS